MSPQEKYGTAELFMLFVTRMEMYPESYIKEIKNYIMERYSEAIQDNYDRALEACVGQFLTHLVEVVKGND